jgi:hypothetical protein
MLDLALLIVLGATSAGVGLAVLRRLGGIPEHPSDALGLAVPLGLGLLGLATLGLGLARSLTLTAVAALLGVLALIALFEARSWSRHGSPRFISRGPRTPTDWLFDATLALTLLGTLLTALAPATDGDALCYHLQVPKVFLERQAVWFDADLHETVYPLLAEMLYAVCLAFRGTVACRLVQWLLGICFAACVTALARPALGHRARWAGTIALLVPAVSNGMSAPLNDVALATYCNCTLYAWIRWYEEKTGSRAFLAGVLAGLAMSVKYPALVWVGLLGLAMAVVVGVDAVRRASHRARSLAQVAAFALAALCVGGIWYARAYVHTGNPVHPFFKQAFGGAGLDVVLEPAKRPLPVTPWNLLTALGPLTLDPDRFDSVAHQFGPVFLMALPALLVIRPPRRVAALVLFGFAFLGLCLTQRQSMRFVLAAIGPWSVGVAWLADRAGRHARGSVCDAIRRPRFAIQTLLLLVLVGESALALSRARHGLAVVLGREPARSYLVRREPTFAVGRWIAAHLPRDARIIGQDHRGFYIPRPYTMELAHRRRTGLAANGEAADDIIRILKIRGFTHILLCPPVPEDAVEFDATLGRRLAPWLAARRPVYRADLSDADGVMRRYAIYSLDAPATSGQLAGVRP